MTKSLIPIIESKLPTFVRDMYPNFVQFLRDYYGFLEQDENFLRIIEDWRLNNEASLENDAFLDTFLRDNGWNIDQDIQIRKSLLLHGLKDFYLSRGTERSFKFLWRVLYGEDVEIRYPRDELLIPSFANYGERYFIYVTLNNQNTENFRYILENVSEIGGSIRGLVSKSQADIENIQISLGFGESFLQVETLIPIFPFQVGELVDITVAGITIQETIKPVLSVIIDDGGTGYRVGDSITVAPAAISGQGMVSSVDSGPVESLIIQTPGTGYSVGDRIKAVTRTDGFGFSARVSEVDIDGGIVDYLIESNGYAYSEIPDIQIKGSGTGAIILAVGQKLGSIKSVLFSEPALGYSSSNISIFSETGSGAILSKTDSSFHSLRGWENRIGFLNETSRLIDSYKYQQFSYSIVSPIQHHRFDRIVSEYLHPVGYVKFGLFEITTESNFGISAEEFNQSTTITLVFEHDLPITIETEFQTVSGATLGLDTGEFILGIVSNGITVPLQVVEPEELGSGGTPINPPLDI